MCACSVAHLCLTLCDPMDCSPPGCSVHGILQARTLEWEAIRFSRGPSQPRDQTQVSRIAGRFFSTVTSGKPVKTGDRNNLYGKRTWKRIYISESLCCYLELTQRCKSTVCVLVLLRLTLCGPLDSSLSGCSVHGIF